MKSITLLAVILIHSISVKATPNFQRLRIAEGAYPCTEYIPANCFDRELHTPTENDAFNESTPNLFIVRKKKNLEPDTIPLAQAIGTIVKIWGNNTSTGFYVEPLENYKAEDLTFLAKGKSGLIGGVSSDVTVNYPWEENVVKVEKAIKQIETFEEKYWKELIGSSYAEIMDEYDVHILFSNLNAIQLNLIQEIIWLYRSDVFSLDFKNEFAGKFVELGALANTLSHQKIVPQKEVDQFRSKYEILFSQTPFHLQKSPEPNGELSLIPPNEPPVNSSRDYEAGRENYTPAELKEKIDNGCSIDEICLSLKDKNLIGTLKCTDENGNAVSFSVGTDGTLKIGFEKDGHSAELSVDGSTGKIDLSLSPTLNLEK